MELSVKKEDGYTGKIRLNTDEDGYLILEIERKDIIDSQGSENYLWDRAKLKDLDYFEMKGE
jgi:hypothetical protein